VRLAALAALAVAVASGCGSVESDAGEAGTSSVQDGRPSKLWTFDRGSSSSLAWYVGDDAERDRTAVRKLYAVFRRAQTPREAEIALRVATDCISPEGESDEIGEPIHGLTRILLRGIGPRRYDLVAQPTTRDTVSVRLFPDGSGSCGAEAMDDGLTVSSEVDETGFAIVYGMLGNGVTGVDLVIDDASQQVQLGENGFAHEIPDALGKTLHKMILRHADGSVTTFPAG
jgi:hypothetical protein